MSTEHPITPPPELVRQWAVYKTGHESAEQLWHNVATQASNWGWEQRGAANEAELQKARDQELEACCEWLQGYFSDSCAYLLLREDRRPKPPSLKQQALEALQRAEEGWRPIPDDCDTIRRALEALPDD